MSKSMGATGESAAVSGTCEAARVSPVVRPAAWDTVTHLHVSTVPAPDV